jgi:peptidoglycan/LPS O-acetylase OafA/YrhL
MGCMITQLSETKNIRIPALDGFRGLAVLMVTLYRFGEVSLTESVVGKWASKAVYLGASGVDLFFVLSGFLITGILLEQKGSSKYFSTFYARRSLRIFPLYFASLILFLWLLPSLGVNSILTGRTIDGGPKEITGNTLHL